MDFPDHPCRYYRPADLCAEVEFQPAGDRSDQGEAGHHIHPVAR